MSVLQIARVPKFFSWRSGALEFRHVVAPFAAFRIVGRKADEFDGVPLDVLAELVAVTQTGAVWDQIRRALC